MKILTDKQHSDLMAQASAFVQIAEAVAQAGEDITAEDITAETVIQMVQADEAAEIIDLQPQLDAANARISELETQLETANSRVSELEADLDNQPAEQSASIAPKAEASGEKMDIIDFAAKNQNDPFAILEKAEKEGLI